MIPVLPAIRIRTFTVPSGRYFLIAWAVGTPDGWTPEFMVPALGLS